jgi:hypothetical protein
MSTTPLPAKAELVASEGDRKVLDEELAKEPWFGLTS